MLDVKFGNIDTSVFNGNQWGGRGVGNVFEMQTGDKTSTNSRRRQMSEWCESKEAARAGGNSQHSDALSGPARQPDRFSALKYK